MSQTDLCVKTDFSPQQISDYVNGRRQMSLQNSISIAEAVRCDPRDLYELIPVQNTKN